MHNHLFSDGVQLSDLIDTNDYDAVFDEVELIVMRDYPSFDVKRLSDAFYDIVRLFNGEFPGYRKCNTEYHDLSHTLETILAMSRLINGYNHECGRLSQHGAFLGLLGALMHDTGYIQSDNDNSGTGAKHTLHHIARSIEFMRFYFTREKYTDIETTYCAACILCTNINAEIDSIGFTSREHETLGKMLGIADLLSQMADRNYLEKLILLYTEFSEGKVNGFENELDLFSKTVGFFEFTRKRFADQMDNLDRFMKSHFRLRWNIDDDLYRSAVEKNTVYLRFLMEQKQDNFRDYLRRESGNSGRDEIDNIAP